MLEDEIGELDVKHRHFVAVCELCAPQDHVRDYHWIGNGSPPKSRLALCNSLNYQSCRGRMGAAAAIMSIPAPVATSDWTGRGSVVGATLTNRRITAGSTAGDENLLRNDPDGGRIVAKGLGRPSVSHKCCLQQFRPRLSSL